MSTPTRCLLFLFGITVVLLPACSPDPDPENLEEVMKRVVDDPRATQSLNELREFGGDIHARAAGPLRDVDIENWCKVEAAGRMARGSQDAYGSVQVMADARKKACTELGITSLEHQVVNARVTVALHHLDLSIPVPAEKEAEVALVKKHRAAIDAARGR